MGMLPQKIQACGEGVHGVINIQYLAELVSSLIVETRRQDGGLCKKRHTLGVGIRTISVT